MQPHYDDKPNVFDHHNPKGQFLIADNTYGSPNHTYVWEGGLRLLILYTALNDGANLEIDSELAPDVIQLRNYKTSVTFNVGREPGKPA